jgi:Astacin (Peptidase family M12A)
MKLSTGMEFNFRKYSWKDIQSMNVSYDTSSVMHYGPYAFAKDRRYPTILPKIPNDRMGQRDGFSPVRYSL